MRVVYIINIVDSIILFHTYLVRLLLQGRLQINDEILWRDVRCTRTLRATVPGH